MTDFEKKLAEELAKQSVEKLAAPAVMPLQAIGEAIAGHVKSWRWVHQGRLLNKKSDAEIDQAIQETVQVIEAKVSAIPSEYLQSPPLRLYGPTVQALGYTVDEPKIREMFANLLTSSMDSRKINSIHPAFVEIVSQLSSSEAGVLKDMSASNDNSFPICNLCRMTGGDGEYTVIENSIYLIGRGKFNLLDPARSTIVDNLERLRLIEVDMQFRSLGGEAAYDALHKAIKLSYPNDEIKNDNPVFNIGYPAERQIGQLYFQNGIIEMTSFGKEFCRVVLS